MKPQIVKKTVVLGMIIAFAASFCGGGIALATPTCADGVCCDDNGGGSPYVCVKWSDEENDPVVTVHYDVGFSVA